MEIFLLLISIKPYIVATPLLSSNVGLWLLGYGGLDVFYLVWDFSTLFAYNLVKDWTHLWVSWQTNTEFTDSCFRLGRLLNQTGYVETLINTYETREWLSLFCTRKLSVLFRVDASSYLRYHVNNTGLVILNLLLVTEWAYMNCFISLRIKCFSTQWAVLMISYVINLLTMTTIYVVRENCMINWEIPLLD